MVEPGRARFLSAFAAAMVPLLASLALLPSVATAQKFPDRPIKLVVPFAVGGGTDILARQIAPRLGEALGQAVIVENRGGAGGNIGFEAVAKSPADGYTLLFGNNSLTINAGLYKNLAFDAGKSFAPVGVIATAPLVLVTTPDQPIANVTELVAQARARPGALNWSSPGSGTPGHLATELFNKLTGTSITHVQYKGGGPSVIDLLGKHTQVSIQTLAAVKPFIDTGKLRPLAVAAGRRTKLMPDLPTIAEAGVPGYEADLWYALFVPAGTPEPVVRTLNAALNKVLSDKEVQQLLFGSGFEVMPGSSENLRTLFTTDLARTVKLIADTGIKVE